MAPPEEQELPRALPAAELLFQAPRAEAFPPEVPPAAGAGSRGSSWQAGALQAPPRSAGTRAAPEQFLKLREQGAAATLPYQCLTKKLMEPTARREIGVPEGLGAPGLQQGTACAALQGGWCQQ